MTYDEMIKILETERDGLVVECRGKNGKHWNPKQHKGISPDAYDYRLKPVPRRGEGWISKDISQPLIHREKVYDAQIHIRWEEIMEDEL